MLGGDLVDSDTPYAARDKIQHVLLLGALWLLLALVPWPWWARLAAWCAIACGWELFEGARLWYWWKHTEAARRLGWEWNWDTWTWVPRVPLPGRPIPPLPPRFADRPSWRDLVANLVGLLLAQLYLWAPAIIAFAARWIP